MNLHTESAHSGCTYARGEAQAPRVTAARISPDGSPGCKRHSSRSGIGGAFSVRDGSPLVILRKLENGLTFALRSLRPLFPLRGNCPGKCSCGAPCPLWRFHLGPCYCGRHSLQTFVPFAAINFRTNVVALALRCLSRTLFLALKNFACPRKAWTHAQ